MTSQAMTRRRLLTAMALAVPTLVACAPARPAQAEGPDPLVALAAAARADAALAAAVIAASPNLMGRVAPLRDARTEHAVALEAEVARAAGATASASPTSTPPTSAPAVPTGAATLGSLRTAVGAAGSAAGEVAGVADVHRVGLVASVSACCTTYAAALA